MTIGAVYFFLNDNPRHPEYLAMVREANSVVSQVDSLETKLKDAAVDFSKPGADYISELSSLRQQYQQLKAEEYKLLSNPAYIEASVEVNSYRKRKLGSGTVGIIGLIMAAFAGGLYYDRKKEEKRPLEPSSGNSDLTPQALRH